MAFPPPDSMTIFNMESLYGSGMPITVFSWEIYSLIRLITEYLNITVIIKIIH